jgi:hypothetical protein
MTPAFIGADTSHDLHGCVFVLPSEEDGSNAKKNFRKNL